MAEKPVKKAKQSVPSASRGLLGQLAAMPEHLACGNFRHQFAALCFQRSPAANDMEVLVITSRDTGRWIIPKGWPMKKRNRMRRLL